MSTNHDTYQAALTAAIEAVNAIAERKDREAQQVSPAALGEEFNTRRYTQAVSEFAGACEALAALRSMLSEYLAVSA